MNSLSFVLITWALGLSPGGLWDQQAHAGVPARGAADYDFAAPRHPTPPPLGTRPRRAWSLLPPFRDSRRDRRGPTDEESGWGGRCVASRRRAGSGGRGVPWLTTLMSADDGAWCARRACGGLARACARRLWSAQQVSAVLPWSEGAQRSATVGSECRCRWRWPPCWRRKPVAAQKRRSGANRAEVGCRWAAVHPKTTDSRRMPVLCSVRVYTWWMDARKGVAFNKCRWARSSLEM